MNLGSGWHEDLRVYPAVGGYEVEALVRPRWIPDETGSPLWLDFDVVIQFSLV